MGKIPSRSEIRLWGRSFREKWAVSEDRRTKIIDTLFEILDRDDASIRAKTSATKVLIEAYNSNLLWGKAEAGIEEQGPTFNIRLIKEAPGGDPGAKLLREGYRDE
jgi:hypothetical protein